MPATDTQHKERMKILLRNIEQLPQDVYNYVRLNDVVVDDNSGKAFMITCSAFTSHWIATSTLKKDNNNNIWLKEFVYKRIMERNV